MNGGNPPQRNGVRVPFRSRTSRTHNDRMVGPAGMLRILSAVLLWCAFSTATFALDRDADVQPVYLYRIVAQANDLTYPDPLRVRPEHVKVGPSDLGEATERLLGMVPVDFAVASGIDAAEFCEFDSPDDWADDFGNCGKVVCDGLPERSQDPGCGYLTRLSQWIESNWLGGLCQFVEVDRHLTPLFRWFSERRLAHCFQMSEVVAAAYYRRALGLPVDEIALIRAVQRGKAG